MVARDNRPPIKITSGPLPEAGRAWPRKFIASDKRLLDGPLRHFVARLGGQQLACQASAGLFARLLLMQSH